MCHKINSIYGDVLKTITGKDIVPWYPILTGSLIWKKLLPPSVSICLSYIPLCPSKKECLFPFLIFAKHLICVQKVFKRAIVHVIQFENMTLYIEGYPLYLFIWIKFHILYIQFYSQGFEIRTIYLHLSTGSTCMKIKGIPDKSFCNVARASFYLGQANPRNLFKLGYKCHEVPSWLIVR